MQNHLSNILELLLDPDQLTKSSHSSHYSLLSLEAAQALDFLLEGTVDKNRTVHSFINLALWHPLQTVSGYSKTSETFSLKKLQAWIKECFVVNPFGMSACIKSGRKLAWAQQSKKKLLLLFLLCVGWCINLQESHHPIFVNAG